MVRSHQAMMSDGREWDSSAPTIQRRHSSAAVSAPRLFSAKYFSAKAFQRRQLFLWEIILEYDYCIILKYDYCLDIVGALSTSFYAYLVI